MKKEIRKFEIALYIVDKNKKFESLEKREDLEVRWKGKEGRAEKEVIFEKGDKFYRVLVRAELRRGSLKDRVIRSRTFSPPNVDYQCSEGRLLKLVSPWRIGNIVFFGFLILTLIIIFYFFWKRLKKQQKFSK